MVIAGGAKLPADDYSVLHPLWQRTNPTFGQINITLQTRREKGMEVAMARLDDSPKPEIQRATESGPQAGQGGHEQDAPDQPTEAEQSKTPPSEPQTEEGATDSREPLAATPPVTSTSSTDTPASQPDSAAEAPDRAGQTDHYEGAQEASPPPAPEQHGCFQCRWADAAGQPSATRPSCTAAENIHRTGRSARRAEPGADNAACRGRPGGPHMPARHGGD